MFLDAMCWASERAIAMCEGLSPGEEPQNTQIFVGGGMVLEELVVWANGEETEVLVGLVSWREGTGEEDVRGETPPDAMLRVLFWEYGWVCTEVC